MCAPSSPGVARPVTRVTMLTAGTACLVLFALAACATPRSGDDGADSAGVPKRADSTVPGAAMGGSAGSSATGAPGATEGSASPAAGGQARITIELDRTRYAPGATVNLRIVNRDDAGYGFSACPRTIERRRGSGWVTVPEEGRMCTMMLQLLGARETVMAETDLPTPLERGEYRIAITFSREEGPAPGRDTPPPAPAPTRVTSAAFRVE